MGFTGFYWVFDDATGFLPSFTGFLLSELAELETESAGFKNSRRSSRDVGPRRWARHCETVGALKQWRSFGFVLLVVFFCLVASEED